MLVRTYAEANRTGGEPSGLTCIGNDKLWTTAKTAFKKLPSEDRRATGDVQLDPDPTAAAAAAAPPAPAVDPPPAAAAADDDDRDGDGATRPPAFMWPQPTPPPLPGAPRTRTIPPGHPQPCWRWWRRLIPLHAGRFPKSPGNYRCTTGGMRSTARLFARAALW